jgi:hypothetical protein
MSGRFALHARRQWAGFLALFLVLGGGTAVAAYVVTSNSQIGPNTVSGHNTPSSAYHANIVAKSISATDLRPADRPNLVGDANGPAFAPAFNGSLTWQSSPPNVAVGFWRDPYGVVHLQGALCVQDNGGCLANEITNDDDIFILPAGYHPAGYAHFATATGNDHPPGSVLITPDGTVLARSGSYAEFSLDGITFRCAPAGANGCP